MRGMQGSLALLFISATVYSGIPCPNPRSFQVFDDTCGFAHGGGYIVNSGWVLFGDCVRPGNSAKKCETRFANYVIQRKTLTNPYRDLLGIPRFAGCEDGLRIRV
jgi:hypothetical protein